MKIGQPSDTSVALTPPATPKAGQSSGASPTREAQTAGVAVTMSARARELEQTSRTETEQVDTEKVESVRAAIQQGTYVVNPEAIADKLLANAKEMLDRTRS
ncbi:MAG: flagellar biosynthesis anti-sigma factor FlgM [Gammaproteobacteria bacterium]|jgi:negative regulator of flagellin synthesis FlgM|nr:flagellar biosynthesis anti-sigma factor FlgM [Gammaproteobacteria bacterium]MBU0785923.1 flagellar biosynthesis anti-sigma factor FlgM [Gammaproteobacteria bacterium]MBU0816536.1 flagellar biosynthesis anti-sigma factor FlgM [Gammaproteobacteria bacterium]MBU1788337.1 flagellar biosynthesis anti-sigma factor FlgM [Gammaproteobacteria bacterium]